MSDRLLVATRKGLFMLRANGARPSTWRISNTAFLADPVYIAAHDPRDGSFYAALGHGHFGVKLHRSDDGGASWQALATPEYPKRAEGAGPEICAMSGREIPWRTEMIWSLAPGAENQPGVLWCGTVPGGLFRSEDRGASWAMVRSLWDHPKRKLWFGGGLDYPGIHSIIVDPRNPNRVLLGVSCGGVWETLDGGESWQCRADGMRAAYMPPERAGEPEIQDPHMLCACPTDPDKLWVQHHNGIFRSTNGARSWSEISSATPSTFGFAVAVHPSDGETAWFVPAIKDEHRYPVDAQVVVTRTRDGGKSFDELRNGLPQEHAYDLTFRHAMDVDKTGERLAFGSTTGSLWTTDDAGAQWDMVSSHLPPVYCVRFVQ